MRLTKNSGFSSNPKVLLGSENIDVLNLPSTLEKILKKAKIDSVRTFYKLKRKRLLRMKGIGRKSSWFLMTEKRKIKLTPQPYLPEVKKVVIRKGDPQISIFKEFAFPEKIFNDDPIDILGFPTRTENTLKIHGVETMEEFNNIPLEKILKFRNIGMKSIKLFDLVKKHIALNIGPARNANTDKVSQISTIVEEKPIPSEMLIGMLIERAGDERSINIIKRRFGLDNDERETLEEIGHDYGITRERVRQIQVRATMRMQHSSTQGRKNVISLVTNMLQENGIVISDSEADILIGKVFNSSKFDGSSFLDLFI